MALDYSSIKTISEFMRLLPLYDAFDLGEFIAATYKTIPEIQTTSSHIRNRNAGIMVITGQRSSPIKDDAEVMAAVIKLFHKPGGAIDTFCMECGTKSVFRLDHVQPEKIEPELTEIPYSYYCHFKCTRCNNQELIFGLRVEGRKIQKICQYPAEIELISDELKKYKKELKSYAPELNRAVGLKTYGIGIGSFVYLRRIFEKLIFDAFEKTSPTEEDTKKFRTLKIAEKIDLVQDHLPPTLVKHKKIHSILSKGIHELEETECLEAFDTVRTGIELILDEVIAEKESEQKKKKLECDLGGIE